MLLTMVQQMGERQHRLLIHFININAHIYRQVYLGDPHAKRDAVQQRLELDFRPRDYGARYTSLRPACRQALFMLAWYLIFCPRLNERAIVWVSWMSCVVQPDLRVA